MIWREAKAAWKRLPAERRRRLTISISLAAVVIMLWLAAVDLNTFVFSRILVGFLFSPFLLSFVTSQTWSIATRKAFVAVMVAGFIAVVLWLMFLPLGGDLWANVLWKGAFFAYLLFGLFLAERQWRCALIEPAGLLEIIETAARRIEEHLRLERVASEQGPLTPQGLPQHVFIRYSNGNWLEWFHPTRRRTWPVSNVYYVVQSNGKHANRLLRRWIGSYCDVRGRRQPEWLEIAERASVRGRDHDGA